MESLTGYRCPEPPERSTKCFWVGSAWGRESKAGENLIAAFSSFMAVAEESLGA